MALLTAEDVLNKAFSKTKYREGFDQDEVDDFLDEVANTIAQLTAERDDFAARAANGGGAPAAAAPVAAAPVEAPTSTGLLAAATEPGGANPTGMLAMAQKLHDEYVNAGEAERDRIVSEAHTAADQIRERADQDAKTRMDDLAGERADLEARIDDLRRFERDYRARLKAYLENLLGDLDHAGVAGAAGLAADVPGSAFGAGDAVSDAAGADDEQSEEFETFVVEDVVVADVYEGEEGEPDIVVLEEYQSVTPVSFDEALNGFQPEAPAAEQPAQEDGAPQESATHDSEPAAPASFDVSQPWESQLRPPADAPPANPFAPVTPPQGDAAASPWGEVAPGDVPVVAAPEETQDAPFTPPSSRMFNDEFGQQHPEENK